MTQSTLPSGTLSLQAQGLAEERVAEVAIQVEALTLPMKIIDWTTNRNVQNQMRRALDDYLYELERSQSLGLATEALDQLIDQIVEVARARDRHV